MKSLEKILADCMNNSDIPEKIWNTFLSTFKEPNDVFEFRNTLEREGFEPYKMELYNAFKEIEAFTWSDINEFTTLDKAWLFQGSAIEYIKDFLNNSYNLPSLIQPNIAYEDILSDLEAKEALSVYELPASRTLIIWN